MRAALYCSVNPADIDIQYQESWLDQKTLWTSLKAHPAFQGRKFPELCDAGAWDDSIHNNFSSSSRAVVLTASMTLNESAVGPALLLNLHPLKREQSCRLYRRFNSDRFLDLRIPALDDWKIPGLPKEGLEEIVAHWLTRTPHPFLARSWAAFWVRNERRKAVLKEPLIGREPDSRGYERISLFAVDGIGFLPTQISLLLNDVDPKSRVRCTRDSMLQWLLRFDKNRNEPYLKFFSRVSLGTEFLLPPCLENTY